MSGEVQRPGGLPDPAQLRISDAERHQVAELLREAAGEGRLDLDELDQRLEATYAARTYADLVPITLDLPGSPATTPGVPVAPVVRPAGAGSELIVAGPEKESHLAILSGIDRKGVWIVPREMSVLALMGGADLDMRHAKFAAQHVTLTINCFMGGAHVRVGPNVRVQMEGTGIMGGYAGPGGEDDQTDESSPVLHVRGVAIWGGVHVERKDD